MPGAFSIVPIVPMSAGQSTQAPDVIYETSNAILGGVLGITPGVRVHEFSGNGGTISSIGGIHEAGEVVTIIFTQAGVTFGFGYLAGGLNFVSTAASTLTLAFNGTNWYEVARSESLSYASGD